MKKYNENTKEPKSTYKEYQDKLSQNFKECKVVEIEETFDRLCENYQKKTRKVILGDEERVFKCLKIRQNIEKNKPLNIEIRLNSKLYFSACNKICELKETIIRFWTEDMSEPEYIILENDSLTVASIFVSDNDAFLAICDKNGVTSCLELVDFCMISIAENAVTGDEYGLVVEYVWFDEQHYREYIENYNMESVKKLFFEEWYGDRIKHTQKIAIKNKSAVMLDYV